jgi:hypothetical protein
MPTHQVIALEHEAAQGALYDLGPRANVIRNQQLLALFGERTVLRLSEIVWRMHEVNGRPGWPLTFEAKRVGDLMRWSREEGVVRRTSSAGEPAWRIIDRRVRYMEIGPEGNRQVVKTVDPTPTEPSILGMLAVEIGRQESLRRFIAEAQRTKAAQALDRLAVVDREAPVPRSLHRFAPDKARTVVALRDVLIEAAGKNGIIVTVLEDYLEELRLREIANATWSDRLLEAERAPHGYRRAGAPIDLNEALINFFGKEVSLSLAGVRRRLRHFARRGEINTNPADIAARAVGRAFSWGIENGLVARSTKHSKPCWTLLDNEMNFATVGPAKARRVIRIRNLPTPLLQAQAALDMDLDWMRRQRDDKFHATIWSKEARAHLEDMRELRRDAPLSPTLREKAGVDGTLLSTAPLLIDIVRESDRTTGEIVLGEIRQQCADLRRQAAVEDAALKEAKKLADAMPPIDDDDLRAIEDIVF